MQEKIKSQAITFDDALLGASLQQCAAHGSGREHEAYPPDPDEHSNSQLPNGYRYGERDGHCLAQEGGLA